MRLDEAAIEKESKVEEKVDEEGKTKAENEGEQAEDGKEKEGEVENKNSNEDSNQLSKVSSQDQPTSPEQVAENASMETNPISPPLEDASLKSGAPPLNHSIEKQAPSQANADPAQLEESIGTSSASNSSTSESISHLTQGDELPQRGRTVRISKQES